MLKLSIADIVKETGARFTGKDSIITQISTDTRDLPDGCLFVALTGDNFDGHKFIGKALENGAAYAVAMSAGDWDPERILYVNDTRDALLAIARLHRKSCRAKVVAITGSVGKTTTKEMISCVLESSYKTLKTEKNLNNEVGLSKTVLQLDDSIEAAVFEMGTDGPGQIIKLSQTALPDIAVVTNIGVSHIEAFKTRQGILSEKMDICAGLKSGSNLILCDDNDLLKLVDRPEYNVLRYSIENPDCPVRATGIQEYSSHTNFEILWDGSRFDAQIPTLGRHNVLNALAAFCVGLCMDIPAHISIAALKNYRPAGMRQNIVVHNSYTVVEDCYNASPDSMNAALETLGKIKCDGNKIAVLSDMLELGGLAPQLHKACGEIAAVCGIDYLLCTGEHARNYVDGAKAKGMKNAIYFGGKQEVFEYIKNMVKPGDVLWFKASRGMRLEEIIEQIYAL